MMAWYGAGLRAIDIRDPTHPKEVGRTRYKIRDDFPDAERSTKEDPLGGLLVGADIQPGQRFAGQDTYDVVFGPRGQVYVPDGTAGMRVLRYTGPLASPGPVPRPGNGYAAGPAVADRHDVVSRVRANRQNRSQTKKRRNRQLRGNVQQAATATCGTATVLPLTTVRLGPEGYDVRLQGWESSGGIVDIFTSWQCPEQMPGRPIIAPHHWCFHVGRIASGQTVMTAVGFRYAFCWPSKLNDCNCQSDVRRMRRPRIKWESPNSCQRYPNWRASR